MKKYQVRDTTPDDDYNHFEIPIQGTKEECEAWASRHNAKVVAAGGESPFVVEEIRQYVVWGSASYVGRTTIEAGSEDEAMRRFELDVSVDDLNIKGGDGMVAQSAEAVA